MSSGPSTEGPCGTACGSASVELDLVQRMCVGPSTITCTPLPGPLGQAADLLRSLIWIGYGRVGQALAEAKRVKVTSPRRARRRSLGSYCLSGCRGCGAASTWPGCRPRDFTDPTFFAKADVRRSRPRRGWPASGELVLDRVIDGVEMLFLQGDGIIE